MTSPAVHVLLPAGTVVIAQGDWLAFLAKRLTVEDLKQRATEVGPPR